MMPRLDPKRPPMGEGRVETSEFHGPSVILERPPVVPVATHDDAFVLEKTPHGGVDFLRRQLANATAGRPLEIPGIDDEALQRMVDKHGPALEALMKGDLKPKQVRAFAKTLVAELATEVASFQDSGAEIPSEDLKELQDALTSGNAVDLDKEIGRLRSVAGTAGKVGASLTMLYMFLVGVSGISGGVKMLGADYVDMFFAATSNPAVGLVSGMLATALFQSSSATTSLLVGMVAGGALPVEAAIPMVMGANLGTTVTNTLASLATAGGKEDFQRTFQAATVHDMFNVMTVGVLLPLELTTGVLEKTSGVLTDWVLSAGIQTGEAGSSIIKSAIKAGVEPLKQVAELASSSPEVQAGIVLALAASTMVAGLAGLSKILKKGFGEQLKTFLQKPFQKHPVVGIATGAGATMAVQSSSVVTSALLPLAAAGALTMPQILAITVGANMGTTTTAILAALAATGVAASSGLQIALVHTLFNSFGAALLYPVKAIREFPIKAAAMAAHLVGRSRPLALAVVLGVFFAGPGAILGINYLQQPAEEEVSGPEMLAEAPPPVTPNGPR